MNQHISNIQNLMALDEEIDNIVDEFGVAEEEPVVKMHTMIVERYTTGETRFVCTCGNVSRPARNKVTVQRVIRHTRKTGHQWVPANQDQDEKLDVPSVQED